MKSFVIAVLASAGAYFLLPALSPRFYHVAFGLGGAAFTYLFLCCVIVFFVAFKSVD